MLGGHLSLDLLLLAHKLLEAGGGEGECLPPQPHQIGILQPRVVEAVFDGGTCPGIQHHIHKNKSAVTLTLPKGNSTAEREIDKIYRKESILYIPRVAAQDLLKEQRGTLGYILV